MVSTERVRELLFRHGTLLSQPVGDWKGDFPLPVEVEQFYREVGPVDVTIESHGNPYFLPSLAGLWGLQAGYRWHGFTGERLPGWDDDWLVVGYEGGDAFIFSRRSGRIMYALHGAGAWEPREVFPNLNAMAACLALLGSVVLDAGDRFTDKDCVIRPEHIETATIRQGEVLGSRADAESVLGVLGWVDRGHG
jgi:hypothetical protein